MIALEQGAVVLLGGQGASTRIVYQAVRDQLPIAGVILEASGSRRALLARRARRFGWRKALGQALFSALAAPLLALGARRREQEILRESGLWDRPIDPDIVLQVPSINDDATARHLRALRPKLVIIHGVGILSRELLSEIDAPVLNVHAGVTPLFRGVHGGYWALVEGMPEACGVTVHRVDPGIDTGAIAAQARIHPTSRDNFTTYPLLQLAVGLPLLLEVARAALADSLPNVARPPGESRLWSHPTLWEYLRHRWRRGVR